jgi:hypothetical protein
MKISHKDLEACRTSPKAWVMQKKEQSQGTGGPRWSYKQALNYSICELHKANSLEDALKKLDGYLEKFKDPKRIEVIRETLMQYSVWLEKSGTVPVDSNITLKYPFDGDWHLGGIISRIDILSSGYRAVLFEAISPNWKAQLRMPLIQLAVADRYGRPESEIRVGFQDLDSNDTVDYRFAKATMEAARVEFLKIGSKVLKLWSPQNK